MKLSKALCQKLHEFWQNESDSQADKGNPDKSYRAITLACKYWGAAL